MSTSRKKSAATKKTPAPRPAAKSTATKPSAPAVKASIQTIGLEEIKSLIALVGREPFQEFEFEAGDMRFRIRKDGPAPVFQAPAAAPIVMAAPAPSPAHHIPSVPAAPQAPADEPGIHYVTSPIVGTFYRSSNPTATPFTSPGDFVKPGQTLCIIEAMKLMNEIESDVAGEVVKVLVENGTPVEYGERLFAVRIG
ncbi:MAG: acetyl-CoA carboxylase biotin carboxyl carrier protein [Acidobacteria bacterium]|nr:acetyl-CoA carboxylase biotin carboxyl carrier protein [Acidobacteriota bacterium]MBI1856511.1 acetyl-CoA carboxylase biotin carboxyl carrier protein [Chloroflexota bacterium]MBI3488021.1 acetyl-CoA carboxylase biotin carboxyl carrier protein [Acidobacteriota bacterium]